VPTGDEQNPGEVVDFYPDDLCSKFGFGDGDMLYELIQEHDLGVDHQELLIAVIERLVVPQLDVVVETYTLPSIHNPIRAATIDGEKADPYDFISDEIIRIPVADIIEVARTLPPVEDTDW